jgi:predicted nucleic acid-binding protein
VTSSDPRLVFLDACCILNLLATERAEDILRTLPERFAVARYVADREVLKMGKVSLERLRETDVVEVMDPSPEEAGLVVRFALDVDDGEAHTFALALARNGLVATDDRKAIRLIRAVSRESPRLGNLNPVLRTSQILVAWAHEARITDRRLGRLLHKIARDASFVPPRDDPHHAYWVDLLRSAT